MAKPTTDFLAPGKVALLARKSTQTVKRWGEAGLLGEVTKTAGGQRRYPREAVEAFLASREAEAAA